MRISLVTLSLPMILITACGSKSALLFDEPAPGLSPPTVDTGVPVDAGFDTTPCSWSYGQPLDLGPSLQVTPLFGAIHGRADVAWLHADAPDPGADRVRRIVSLTDPPRLVRDLPVAPALPVHGLVDGWVTLARDCSLSFFDDEGSPLRLIIGAVDTPPCAFDSLDSGFVDVSSAGTAGRWSSATRMSTRGAVVHDVGSTMPLGGDAPRTVVSPDGDLIARFMGDDLVSATLSRVNGEVLWEGPVGDATGGFAVSAYIAENERPFRAIVITRIAAS